MKTGRVSHDVEANHDTLLGADEHQLSRSHPPSAIQPSCDCQQFVLPILQFPDHSCIIPPL